MELILQKTLIEELNHLVYCSSGERHGFVKNKEGGYCVGDYQLPTINSIIFPNTPSEWFWTSSSGIGYSQSAYYVSFHNGGVITCCRGHTSHIRLVRMEQ